MKKALLVVAMIGIGFAALAQGVVNSFPYTETFDAFPTDNSTFAPYAEPNPQAFPNGWVNQTGDGADWYGRSNSTGSSGTGPSNDHTSGSGTYVFVEDGSNNNPAVGLIRDSVDLSTATTPVLEYWVSSFNNGGAGDNYLIVEVWDGSIWTQVDSVGALANTDWVVRTVDLIAYTGQMVDIRWSVNNSISNFEHDIAIDDVRILNILPNDVGVAEIYAPAGGGRANTSTAFSAAEPVSIVVENFGASPQSNFSVGFLSGATFGTGTITSTINFGDTTAYTFATTVDMSAAGSYTITAATGLASDTSNANDSTSITVTMLDNPAVTLPWSENFDSWPDQTFTNDVFGMDGNDRFDYDAVTGPARVRTNAGFGVGGTPALTLDATATSPASTNYVDITLNMSSYTTADSVLLDFTYVDHGDESSSEDRVWVRGSDTDSWIEAYDLAPGSTTNGDYNVITGINLSTLLDANGQSWSTSSQLRLGQDDNGSASSLTSVDGITFDDIAVYLQPVNDLKAVEITHPSSNGRLNTSSALSATTTVSLRFTNKGVNAQSNVPVGYMGAGSANEVFAGPITSGDTSTYAFATAANLSAAGEYTITAYTALGGDEYVADDTVSVTFRQIANDPVVLPWEEDFESAVDTTYTFNTLGLAGLDRFDFNTSLEGSGRLRLNPFAGAANSGTQALTLDRISGSTVGDSVDITLNMSGYNMTDSILLDFWYLDHGDESSSGDRVWVRGSDTDPWIEVYDLAPASQTNGTYIQVQYINLTAFLAANSQSWSTSTQLRFSQDDNGAATSPTATDGITFDDIKVYVQPVSDMAVLSVEAPGSGCSLSNSETVSIAITNPGFGTISMGTAFNVGFMLDSNAAVVETDTLTADLMPGDTAYYTFTGTVDVSAMGIYNMLAWTSLSGDDDPSNDTLAATISNYTISTFPYFQTFDDQVDAGSNASYVMPEFDNGWLNDQSDDMDWQPRATQPTSGTSTGPASDHTGGGMFMYLEASSPNNPSKAGTFEYPCFDLSGVANPVLSFWYHMYGADMGDLYLVIDTNGTSDTLLSLIGAQQTSHLEAWRNAQIDLSGYVGSTIAVRFAGVTGSGFNSDIAIDDIGIFANAFFSPQPMDATACEGDTVLFTTMHTQDDTLEWIMDAGSGWMAVADDSTMWGQGSDSLWVVLNSNTLGVNFAAVGDEALGLTDTSNTVMAMLGGISIDLGNDTIICDGAVISLDAGAGGANYSWSTGDTTQTIMTGMGGTVTVAITDSVGCVSTDTIAIAVSQPGMDLGSQQNVCGSDTVYLDAGPANTYLWSTGATSQTIAVTTPGTYYYDVTDSLGCTGTDTILIGVGNVPTVVASNDTTICYNDSVSLSASGAVTYEWYIGPFLIDTGATIGGTVDTLANLELTVFGIDSFGCFSTDTVLINVLPIPTPMLGTDTSICSSDSIMLDAGSYTSYMWNDSSTAAMLTVTSSGSYSVMAADSNGCMGADTIMVTVIGSANILDTATICIGDSAFLAGAWQMMAGNYIDTLTASIGCDSIVETTLLVLGGSYSDTVTICDGDSIFVGGAWQTMGGVYTDSLTGSSGCDSIVVTTVNTSSATTGMASATICDGDSVFVGGAWQTMAGTYTDTLVNAAGCDSLLSTTVSVSSATTGSSTSTICDGDSAFVGGAWQTASGMYVDTLTNTSGCDSLHTTTLTVIVPGTGSASAEICEGDSALIGGQFYTMSGIYNDTVQGPFGCDSIVQVTLTVNPLPTVTVTSTQDTLCENFNESSTLTANGAVSYTWSPATWLDATTGASVTCTPTALGGSSESVTYTITGVDANGCSNSAEQTILAQICGGIPGAPNGFTIDAWMNRTTGQLLVDMSNGAAGTYTAQVYDVTGKLILSTELRKPEAAMRFTIDLNDQPAGLYILRLQSGEVVHTTRVYMD